MNWFDRAIGAVSRKISRLTGGLSQDLQAETGGGEAFPGIKELAREAAAEGAVLLRNDGVLPLRAGQTVAVFGRGQIDYFYVGYGSGGDVRAPYRISPLDGLRAQGIVVDEALAARYRDLVAKSPAQHGFWGHWPYSHPEFRLSDDEVHAAADRNEVALILIGRAAGEDRENKLSEGSYYLTEAERFLLRQVSNAFTKTVVLLNIGNPIDFSRIEDPSLRLSAVMIVWQGGMESGNALADLITGKVSPSGRLPDTVARRYSDYPSAESFGNRKFNEYREDVYVGYRYYDTAEVPVRYPFGYGLSYTEFEYSDLRIEKTEIEAGETLRVACTVKNIGSRAGKEIVQLYVGRISDGVFRAEKELKGFVKVDLMPGESKQAEFTLDRRSFAYYNVKLSDWAIEAGQYRISVGASSRDIRLGAEITIHAPEVPAPYDKDAVAEYYHPTTDISEASFVALYGKPMPEAQFDNSVFNYDTTVAELKSRFLGKMFGKLLCFGVKFAVKATDDASRVMQNFVREMLVSNPMRAIGVTAGGAMNLGMLDGMLMMFNGKFFKGLGVLLKSLRFKMKFEKQLAAIEDVQYVSK